MKHFALSEEVTDRHRRLSNTEFRRAMEMLDATLDEMAMRLGIARRLVADYRKDKPIPPAIALAVRHLIFLAAAPKAAERSLEAVDWQRVISR